MCYVTYRRAAISNAVNAGIAVFGYLSIKVLLESNTGCKTTCCSKKDCKIRLEQTVHDKKAVDSSGPAKLADQRDFSPWFRPGELMFDLKTMNGAVFFLRFFRWFNTFVLSSGFCSQVLPYRSTLAVDLGDQARCQSYGAGGLPSA